MAAACSNTHTNRMTLFKFLSDAVLYDTSAKRKYSGHYLSGRQLKTLFFVVRILLRIVLRLTQCLILSISVTTFITNRWTSISCSFA